MKKVIGLLSLSLLLIAFKAHAFTGPDFSADMIISDNTGQVTQAKVYFSDQKMRMEMAGSIIINRFDRQISWVLMPSEGMYMEQPIDAQAQIQAPKDESMIIEKTSQGTDVVDGRPVEKFKITYKLQDRQESMYQWLDNQTTIPLKMQALDGSWTVEYHHVSLSAQDSGLFEIPGGYQKLEMPVMAY